MGRNQSPSAGRTLLYIGNCIKVPLLFEIVKKLKYLPGKIQTYLVTVLYNRMCLIKYVVAVSDTYQDEISDGYFIRDRIYYGRLFIGSKNKLVQRH